MFNFFPTTETIPNTSNLNEADSNAGLSKDEVKAIYFAFQIL
jgi:hypothetical protein